MLPVEFEILVLYKFVCVFFFIQYLITGSNLDGDCGASMDEVELINNDTSSTYICWLSDSPLVDECG